MSGDGPGDREDASGDGDRLRPFEGVRLSKGTTRSRAVSALVRMLRRRRGPDE